ncbi:MAG: cyclic nucleotide-binding domain-containing protein [Sandaracinaceae bacterium]|nr:cyclic nucleotide-binding domain-containing protein [Sandaracinaceae bacterium]
MAESDQLFARFGKTCDSGEVLFREGEAGDTMYVIQSGSVRISKSVKGEDKTLAILGPGEFFGEMAILNAKPRNATAVVEDPAKVLVLGARTFEQMLVSNAEIAVRMIKKLARRLDSANELIEVLMHRDPKARVILGLSREAEAMGRRSPTDPCSSRSGRPSSPSRSASPRRRRPRCSSACDASASSSPRRAGLVITNVARLEEFYAFLEMREKFGDA